MTHNSMSYANQLPWGGLQQQGLSQNPPDCNCHECTQVRWKLSIQGQLSGIRPDPQNHDGQYGKTVPAEKPKAAL